MQYQDIKDALEKELQSTQLSTLSDTQCQIEIMDYIILTFNCNKYLSVAKQLEAFLVKQCKELSHNKEISINDPFKNRYLAKLIYLAKIYLNVFSLFTLLETHQSEYRCFELGILYVGLLEIFEQLPEQELVDLIKKQQDLFFTSDINNKSSLIKVNIDFFRVKYYQEINLFKQQFMMILQLGLRHKGFVFEFEDRKQICLHADTIKLTTALLFNHPSLTYYQLQFRLKMQQLFCIDPVTIYHITADFMDKYVNGVNKSYIIEVFCEDLFCNYLWGIGNYSFNTFNYNNDILKGISYPVTQNLRFNQLQLNLFANLYFGNFKLPELIENCIFISCAFSDDNFKYITYKNCKFFNCSFSYILIHSGFLLSCDFINTHLEYHDITSSRFNKCNFENNMWYRVKGKSIEIVQSNVMNSSILFSNLNAARFSSVTFNSVNFLGSNMKLLSVR